MASNTARTRSTLRLPSVGRLRLLPTAGHLGGVEPHRGLLAPASAAGTASSSSAADFARSSTVLGVGVIAAVGAGGMATAQDRQAPVAISLPDLPDVPRRPPARPPRPPRRRRLLPMSPGRAPRHRRSRSPPRRHAAADTDRATQSDAGRRGRGPARPHPPAGRAAAGRGRRRRRRPPRRSRRRRRPPPRPGEGRRGGEGGRRGQGEGRGRGEGEGGRGRRGEGRGRAPRQAGRELHAAHLLVHPHLHLRPGRLHVVLRLPHRPGLRRPHRHPAQGGPRRHHQVGGLGRLVRLPDRPRAR